MPKHFNTTGPVIPSEHYCIDPMQRMDWEEIHALIATKKFFVLHAPRQTGKTSTLLAMMDTLNQSGEYIALYINVEAAQAARNDVTLGMKSILGALADGAYYRLQDDRLNQWLEETWQKHGATGALKALLNRWAQASTLPIVLMIDEVDALVGDTLISLLRQLREGYIGRPGVPFVQSVILCGVRDVRDYRIHTSHNEIITGGSAFNIKATSLVMGNFTPEEIHALYQQHTDATGQTFADSIFPLLWEDTRGQPWLVNALGYEMTWEDRAARDRRVHISLERYQAARERLIRSRQTHLDQLADKLREPRVHHVVAAILAGEERIENIREDDLQYVEDLGLIQTRPSITISNRIYQEIIPREITWAWQATIPNQETAWYVLADGRLDIPALLRAFQQFFREHSDIWLQGLPFKEAGPQLILQAFLQRIVNGGGRINREYALGRKYTDLLLAWPLDKQQGFYGEVQRVVLELKILRGNLDKTIADGVQQVAGYARRCGSREAYLLIFNRDPAVSWDEKIWHKTGFQDGDLPVSVWGS